MLIASALYYIIVMYILCGCAVVVFLHNLQSGKAASRLCELNYN